MPPILEPIPDSTPPPELQPPTGAEVKALRQWASEVLGSPVTLSMASEFLHVSVDTWKSWEYERRAMNPSFVRDFRRSVELRKSSESETSELGAAPEPQTEPETPTQSKSVDPARIRFYRECAALTREEAAGVIGATERAWRAWETGARPMSVSKLELWKELASKLPAPEERAQTSAPLLHTLKPDTILKPMPDLPRVSEFPYDPEVEREMQEMLETPYIYDAHTAGFLQQQRAEQDALKLAALKAGEARMAAEAARAED